MSNQLFPSDRLDCVVFDLDGTLIDSAQDLARAVNEVLARRDCPTVDPATVPNMIGDGARKLVHRAFAATGDSIDGRLLDEAVNDFIDIYRALPVSDACLYPGVREMLARLSEQGWRLGVCTNKPHQATLEVLDGLDLSGRFHAVAGGDRLDVLKPDARHLLFVIDAAGSVPERSVMIGDNANDVAVARNAGCPVIAVTHGYPRMPHDQLSADILIDDFNAIPTVFGRLPAAVIRE